MKQLDRLIARHPRLRDVDFQRLVQRAKADPAAHWEELVRASAPIVYTTALRLADELRGGEALAEEATAEVFRSIRADDYRRVREYVGFGRWESLLVRWTQQSETLRELRRGRELPQLDGRAIEDPDGGVAAVDERTRGLLEQEGSRFLEHCAKVLRTLHRRDRLLLAMRYEQRLSLDELDELFRLGSPARVASLLGRIRGQMQPIQAVTQSWSLDEHQSEAVLAHVVRAAFADGSMDSAEGQSSAPAVSHG